MPTEVPYTPALLQLASEGKPLPLEGENLMWVQTLLTSGYIQTELMASDDATQLVCRLTPKGEAFYLWLIE